MFGLKSIKHKLSLLLTLCVIFISSAQKKDLNSVEIKETSVDSESEKKLSSSFNQYSLFEIDTESLNKYVQQNLDNEIVLNFEFPNVDDFDIVLRKNNVISDDYKLIIGSDSGRTISDGNRNVTFEGNILNQPNNGVRLTITKDIIHGMIITNDKEYFIEPLHFITGNKKKNTFVLYEAQNLNLYEGTKCGVTDAYKFRKNLENNYRNQALGDCYRVEVAIASDESALTALGGGVTDMEVFNIALMNISAPYFKDFEFDTNVELIFVGQYISTSNTTESEPYSIDCSNCTIQNQLDRFGEWAGTGGFGAIDFDLAHNITAHFGPFGTVGLAWVGTLNQPGYKYAVSSSITNDPTWLVFIHELGHNFGMSHTFEDGQGNTGGFMDYGNGPWIDEFSWNPQYTLNEFEAEVNNAQIETCRSIGTPLVDFESVELVCINSPVEFDNYTLGGATSYDWTFEDGSPSSLTETGPFTSYPSVTTVASFSSTGSKEVSLTATNENGTSSTLTKTVYVHDLTPINPSCIPTGTYNANSYDGGITFFEFNTIRKTSGGVISDDGYYKDFSCSDQTILETRTTYDVNIIQYRPANALNFSTNIGLYIDYNNDGDFLDANETAFSGSTSTSSSLSFSFTTPNSSGVVENAILRARLIVQQLDDINDPCFEPQYNLGQVEDYGVYFGNPLSIDDKNEFVFYVYPNPTKDGNFTVNIPYSSKKTQISLYNALGQLVYNSSTEKNGEYVVQLNNAVASGVYHLRVIQGNNTLTKKLIIQ